MSYLEAEGLSDENRFAFGASHNGSLKANLQEERSADSMDKSGDMLSYVNDSLSSVRFGSFAVADHSVKLDGERESPRRKASGPEWFPRRP